VLKLRRNTDHRSVIAEMRDLHPLRIRKPCEPRDLADAYNVAVSNSFEVLGTLPEDVEDWWTSVRNAILAAARDVLPTVQRPAR